MQIRRPIAPREQRAGRWRCWGLDRAWRTRGWNLFRASMTPRRSHEGFVVSIMNPLVWGFVALIALARAGGYGTMFEPFLAL